MAYLTKNKYQILDTDTYDESGKETDNNTTYGTIVGHDLISDEDTLTEGETEGGRGSAINLTQGSEEEETGHERERKGERKEKGTDRGKVRELIISEVTLEELRLLGEEYEKRDSREPSPVLVDLEKYVAELKREELRMEEERRRRAEEKKEEEERKRARKEKDDRKGETPDRAKDRVKEKKELRSTEKVGVCRVQLERMREDKREDIPPLGAGERKKKRMREERDEEVPGTSGVTIRKEGKRKAEERKKACTDATEEETTMPTAFAGVKEGLKKIKSRVMEIIEYLQPKNIRNSMKEECYTIAKELAETERMLSGGRNDGESERDSDDTELRGFEKMMQIGTQMQKRKIVEEKSPEGVRRKRRKEGETTTTTSRKRTDEHEEGERTMMTRYQKMKDMEETRYAEGESTYAQAASRGRQNETRTEKERSVRRRVTFGDTDEEIRRRHRYDRGTIASDSEEQTSRKRKGILKKTGGGARRRVIVSSESEEEESRGYEAERETRGTMSFVERRMEGIRERARKDYSEAVRSSSRSRWEAPTASTEEEEMQVDTMSPTSVEAYERSRRNHGPREPEQWTELRTKRMKREQRRREREEQRAREEEKQREERRLSEERRARAEKARGARRNIGGGELRKNGTERQGGPPKETS